MAAPSKAWIWDRSLARIASSNPAGGMSLVSVLYCHVGVSAKGGSLVRRSPKEFGVSGRDLETSTMTRPRPTRLVETHTHTQTHTHTHTHTHIYIYIYIYIYIPWPSSLSGCSTIYKDISRLRFD